MMSLFYLMEIGLVSCVAQLWEYLQYDAYLDYRK